MKHNSSSFYFEILVEPYSFEDIFVDFIVEHIQDCVEQLATPYHLVSQNEDISSFNLATFFAPQEQQFTQILIRTTQDPQSILKTLQNFCTLTSERVGEKIDFGFGFKKCRDQDWIRAYQQSVDPVSVGAFYIHPSWHKSAEELGLDLKDMLIDPALAFGSGHHASTSMCLELLSTMNIADQSLLDVGCGSGILSLAASMLGAEVEICDTDPFAIEESFKNFKLNAQTPPHAWVGSISQSTKSYDCIVANIVAEILINLYDDFNQHLKIGGILILSGILDKYKQNVLECFRNFEIQEILQKQEWVTLKLAKVK
ncbi:ribosomal protein L11 methyltransferase [Helicobacter enhydrae]|uniref:Ribosomal protein L11 methyltransferase n=1 Tax=Helicobacter enhydrae TaxID=222136 RepID=A0A1B1U5X5_9HELI|nr:50S ribosomal protein L11 methyltransferase [Helicobacter enhydrae]ANV98095.1 ribosomal protein L11 methyltransferase [Helicobacter enhydrae]